jgi:hypothetical protein
MDPFVRGVNLGGGIPATGPAHEVGATIATGTTVRARNHASTVVCFPPRAGYCPQGYVPAGAHPRIVGPPERPEVMTLGRLQAKWIASPDNPARVATSRRLWRPIICLMAMLLVSQASAEVPNVDVNQLVSRIAAAVAGDPALEGAWLDVDREDNGAGGQRAVFTRVFDSARVDAQAAAMSRIIAEVVPEGGWRIDEQRDRRLPYGSLAQATRAMIQKDPRFAGCALLGARYRENEADGSIGLVPRFQVVQEQPSSGEKRIGLRDPELQFEALVAELRRLMASDPAWAQADISLVDTDGDMQYVAVPTPAGPDENQLMRDIASSIGSDPVLEGAWLDVRLDDQDAPGVAPTLYEFSRVLDSDRSGPQAAALEALIRRLVPDGRFRVDAARDIRLPYARTVTELRSRIGKDPRFEGCDYVGGGYCRNPADESLSWVPRFQVVKEIAPPGRVRGGLRNPDRQFEALVAVCRQLLVSDPVWGKAGVGVLDTLGDKQIITVSEAAGPDENELVRQLEAAIRDRSALHGAWLDVRLDDQGAPEVAPIIYVFSRGFDDSRVGAQSSAMEELIATLVRSGRWRIDTSRDVMLPLASLIQRINEEMDVDPGFAGCLVTSAFYARADNEGPWKLVPQGRLWKASQEPLVHALVRHQMEADPSWARHRVGEAGERIGALAVAAPNPAMAAHYFSEGMHRFWKGDYQGADDALALATLEWPDNVVYRYWRVLAELASGDDAAGERRLAKTIAGFRVQRNSIAHVEVMRSIYRVQGPLRYSLMRAEDKAMVGLTTRESPYSVIGHQLTN